MASKEEHGSENEISGGSDMDKNLPDSKVILPPSSRESIGRLFGSKAGFKDVRDDPNCPNVFHVKELKAVLDDEDNQCNIETKLLSSNLILEVVHLLFCRQWKFIAFSSLPATTDAVETSFNDTG